MLAPRPPHAGFTRDWSSIIFPLSLSLSFCCLGFGGYSLRLLRLRIRNLAKRSEYEYAALTSMSRES
jgi:hypothetical protein